MKAVRFKMILAFCFFVTQHASSQTYINKKDLIEDWQVYQNGLYGKYSNRENKDVSTVYFWIDTDKFAGDYFTIKSLTRFTLFLNGKLAFRGDDSSFYIDSLAKAHQSTRLLVAIYKEGISEETIQTSIETRAVNSISKDESGDKPTAFFRDFVIVAILVLLTLLIVVLRLNPKLASDYFSVTKIFSVRETDDNQIYTRISNSTNIIKCTYASSHTLKNKNKTNNKHTT